MAFPFYIVTSILAGCIHSLSGLSNFFLHGVQFPGMTQFNLKIFSKKNWAVMTRRKALNKYYVLRFIGIHILNETELVPQPSSPALRTRLCTATGLSESWMPGGGGVPLPPPP